LFLEKLLGLCQGGAGKSRPPSRPLTACVRDSVSMGTRCVHVTLYSGQLLALCHVGAWKSWPPGVPPTVGTRSEREETEASAKDSFSKRTRCVRFSLFPGIFCLSVRIGLGNPDLRQKRNPAQRDSVSKRTMCVRVTLFSEQLLPLCQSGARKSRPPGRPPTVGTHSEQAETEARMGGQRLKEEKERVYGPFSGQLLPLCLARAGKSWPPGGLPTVGTRSECLETETCVEGQESVCKRTRCACPPVFGPTFSPLSAWGRELPASREASDRRNALGTG
uniref:Uncharacterized protein n=1 Tax=Varanus komodoensis TaxID=61221 RepID=A0A8D2J2W7_VARKO